VCIRELKPGDRVWVLKDGYAEEMVVQGYGNYRRHVAGAPKNIRKSCGCKCNDCSSLDPPLISDIAVSFSFFNVMLGPERGVPTYKVSTHDLYSSAKEAWQAWADWEFNSETESTAEYEKRRCEALLKRYNVEMTRSVENVDRAYEWAAEAVKAGAKVPRKRDKGKKVRSFRVGSRGWSL